MKQSNAIIGYDTTTLTETGAIPVETEPEEIVIYDATPLTAVQGWESYE
jgi:hypothetical protein